MDEDHSMESRFQAKSIWQMPIQDESLNQMPGESL